MRLRSLLNWDTGGAEPGIDLSRRPDDPEPGESDPLFAGLAGRTQRYRRPVGRKRLQRHAQCQSSANDRGYELWSSRCAECAALHALLVAQNDRRWIRASVPEP